MTRRKIVERSEHSVTELLIKAERVKPGQMTPASNCLLFSAWRMRFRLIPLPRAASFESTSSASPAWPWDGSA
jgi:hypothetical protein